jgi:hypothetical protein
VGISFTTAGTYTGMKMESSSFSGTGVTFNMGATFLNFRPPVNDSDGILKWNSSVYGFMVTNQFMSTKTKVEIPGLEPEKFSMMNFNLMLSGNIGYTFGFGKFRDETKWKGVALDLTYRPSAILTLNDSGGGASLNFLGFGVDVNFNNFTTNASRLAPKAQSKITFFMLPPIKDNPLFITLGYGVTYYIKKR